MSALLLHLGIFVLVHSLLWYMISLLVRRNDVADVGWGLGFILLSLTLLPGRAISAPGIIVLLMVGLWGVRLAWHIGQRLFSSEEDFRYAAWRRQWDNAFYLRSYLQVFLLQHVIMVIVAAPVVLILSAAPALSIFTVAGLLLWLTGFVVQAVADRQMAAFVRDPRNRGTILTSGLWRHSRHPNYLGEILMWTGIALMALPAPMGWVGIASPLLLAWLLRYVSGVPLLESRMAARPGWEAYKAATPVLMPWKWLAGRGGSSVSGIAGG